MKLILLLMLAAGAAVCSIASPTFSWDDYRSDARYARDEARRAREEARREVRRAAEDARRLARETRRNAFESKIEMRGFMCQRNNAAQEDEICSRLAHHGKVRLAGGWPCNYFGVK